MQTVEVKLELDGEYENVYFKTNVTPEVNIMKNVFLNCIPPNIIFCTRAVLRFDNVKVYQLLSNHNFCGTWLGLALKWTKEIRR